MGALARTLLRAAGVAVLSLSLALPASAADEADKGARRTIQPVPSAVPRQARIGGGQQVPLAPSRYTAAQLSAMRPNYRALMPKLGNP